VPEVADPLQWLKLLAIAAVALGLPMALVARSLLPARSPELEPLLYPILGLGVIVDFLVAFSHRPR
jgi:hypothetical protein